MDLMRIIRSLEEFLYEVMTWLLFYPRTLLRVLQRPIATLDYAMTEVREAADDPFGAALSPPLFLMLTVAIGYAAERAAHLGIPPGLPPLVAHILHSAQDTLLVRSLLLAVYPLAFAAEYVNQSDLDLTRQTLRAPFFAQCYVGAVFVLTVALGGLALRLKAPPVPCILWLAAGVGWYLWVNVRWFQRAFGFGVPRALGVALRSFSLATAAMIAVAVAVAL